MARLSIAISWAALGAAALAPLSAEAAERLLVRTQAEFEAAVERVVPGDTIVLADGEWKDFRVVLRGRGRAEAPIVLTAETKGKVVLTGRSDLRLAGEHLLVSGLVFRDGWTPGGEVIAFRARKGEVANHSRVTEVVIDRFNNPSKGESDHWVALYGRNNRFDNSHVAGKANRGATLVVVRDPEHGLENRHRIDHNWFGPRPNLGSNGGETVRIGTSHHSLSPSYTLLENNWFERTDGEIEIVSVKSGSNVIRGNVFWRSRGALTLRHGNDNLLEGNVFLGGGEPHTGGIRVINQGQTVRHNHLQDLRGDGNASALAIMNGVPNSPLNRYHQVEQAVIEHNTFVDVASLEFGAGADAERSAPPVDSRFTNNLILDEVRADPVRVRGDVSGIVFKGNLRTPVEAPTLTQGFRPATPALKPGPLDMRVPAGAIGVGARRDLSPVPREAVGVTWYPKTDAAPALGSGEVVSVPVMEGALAAAVRAAAPGDVLQLAPGRHLADEVLTLSRPLSVAGPDGPGAPTAEIVFTRPTLFQIEEGGSLHLKRVAISGVLAPDAAGNAVVRTSPRGMLSAYALVLEDAVVRDLDVNNGFDVVAASKGTLAERIVLKNVSAETVSGAVVKADAETDDLGLYNVERLEILNSNFRDVRGAVADVYRGGADESTFGPDVRIEGVRVEAAGRAEAAFDLKGVQRATLERITMKDSGPVSVVHTVGAPSLRIADLTLDGTPEPKLVSASEKVEPKVVVERVSVIGGGQ